MQTGVEIECKVQLVAVSHVTYKLKSNPDGPDYEMPKEYILMIRYANGTKDIFTDAGKPKATETAKETSESETAYVVDITKLSDSERCQLGTSDADLYHGYSGAAFAAGLGCGGFGVLACVATRPTPERGIRTTTQSENRALFNDPVYRACYAKKARMRMIESAFGGLGVAVFIAIIVYQISLK